MPEMQTVKPENHFAKTAKRITLLRCVKTIQVAALALETVRASDGEMSEGEHGIWLVLPKFGRICIPYTNIAYWVQE